MTETMNELMPEDFNFNKALETAEVFGLVATYVLALRAHPISQYAGCYVFRLDDNWTLALNGHDLAIPCNPDGCMAWVVQPFGCVVFWNGFFAGQFDMAGGLMAAGSAANEDTLVAALKRQTMLLLECERFCAECGGQLTFKGEPLNEHAQGCGADDWPTQEGVKWSEA